jgi:hypothetical protein
MGTFGKQSERTFLPMTPHSRVTEPCHRAWSRPATWLRTLAY